MGTRSLICVFHKGRFVVAHYAPWDGYPEGEGQGHRILKFLLVSANVERLKDGLEHIYEPSPEELRQLMKENYLLEEKLRKEAMLSGRYLSVEGRRSAMDAGWPSLWLETGAGILEIIARATAEKLVPIQLDLEFANDSDCEWAYVVDLDHGMFEVFAGAVLKDEIAENRFNDVGDEDDTVPNLVKSFSVTELPTTEKEFITTLKQALKEIKDKRRIRAQTLAMRKITVYSPAPQWILASKGTKDSKLGLLNVLSRELRDVIYEYAFSVDSLSHGKAKTGLGLLRSSTLIYEEAIPLLYRSQLFNITFRPEDDTFEYRHIEWDDTDFCWDETASSWDLTYLSYLSANFFDLVQNLKIRLPWPEEVLGSEEILDSNFKLRRAHLQKGISQICNRLQDSTRLRYLDISIDFSCNFEDISSMVCILEPIKMLRGIQDPNITVYGWERGGSCEPRWDLTDEYAEYLENLLMSPHGMPVCSADSIQVFEDLFESSESADESIDPSEPALDIELEDTMIEQYLRDMYNTTDRTALYGVGLSRSNLANDADQKQS